MSIKVAVHSRPKLTRSGFFCHRWRDIVVVAGEQPTGPRGGRHGWVDGRSVGIFRDWQTAREYAERFAAEHGYEYIG